MNWFDILLGLIAASLGIFAGWLMCFAYLSECGVMSFVIGFPIVALSAYTFKTVLECGQLMRVISHIKE